MENNLPHMPPPPPPPPPPQTQATQIATQDTYNFAANLLITQKKKPDEVRNALMQQGLDAQTASTVIGELQVEVTKLKRKNAKRDMMYGGGICFVGLVVTLVSYAAASSDGGGGTYFVTWGAVIFGGIQFFRGLFNLKG